MTKVGSLCTEVFSGVPGGVPVYSRNPVLMDGTCVLKAQDWMESLRETVFTGSWDLPAGRGREEEDVQKHGGNKPAGCGVARWRQAGRAPL